MTLGAQGQVAVMASSAFGNSRISISMAAVRAQIQMGTSYRARTDVKRSSKAFKTSWGRKRWNILTERHVQNEVQWNFGAYGCQKLHGSIIFVCLWAFWAKWWVKWRADFGARRLLAGCSRHCMVARWRGSLPPQQMEVFHGGIPKSSKIIQVMDDHNLVLKTLVLGIPYFKNPPNDPKCLHIFA